MGDQNFNIKVVTTADTAGLRQTGAEMDALSKKAQSTSSSIGSAVGVGTIISLLTASISKWKDFLAEEDKIIDKMFEVTAKMREQALAVAEIKDLDFSEELNKQAQSADELQANIDRLSQKIRVLKAEQDALNPLTQANEWKALRAEIQQYEGQLGRVTSRLKEQNTERQRAAELAEKTAIADERDAQSFLKNAVATASPQVQAALKNEEAARRAREAGDERAADQFQKSADQYKKQLSESERHEYEGITKPVRLGRKAGPGESQTIIDDMARNAINFQRQLAGQPPLPPGAAQGDQALSQAIANAFDQTMQKYFGP